MSDWRTKSKDGKAVRGKDGKPIRFPIEPHGDKSSLPKGVQQVSFWEIPEYVAKQREKNKTEEELAEEAMEEAMVEDAIEAEEKEKSMAKRVADGLTRLDDAIKKQQARAEYQQAIEEKKAERLAEEELAPEPDIASGYGHTWKDRLFQKRAKKKRLIDENEVFG